jgi:hypothetical protein
MFYIFLKRQEILIYATIHINLENTLKSQSQKNYFVIPLQNGQNQVLVAHILALGRQRQENLEFEAT